MLTQAHEKGNESDRSAARLYHPSDAAELRWFYRQGGLTVFSSSTFGQQLERAASVAFGGAPCAPCRGTGFVPSDLKAWHEKSEWERKILEVIVGLEPGALDPPMADRVCRDCRGSGWIPKTRRHNARGELTARPRWGLTGGGSKKGKSGGVEVSDADVARLGAVTARLAKVPFWELNVLAEYYSPGGGTILVLYAFTAAGKTLLRRNSQNLLPRQFFENEIKRQEEKPDKQRGALLEAATKQANEIHRSAVDAWANTKPRGDEELTRRAALRLLDGDA